MRNGWVRRKARRGRAGGAACACRQTRSARWSSTSSTAAPRGGRIGVAELMLSVAVVWAGLAAAPAVESAVRPAEAASHGSGQSGGSVLDGVFTESQASRGEAAFRRVCSACHDTNEFSGGRFRLTWVGQSAGDLFDTIATLMPEGDPGSLTPAQYAAVVAYLLQLNGYPAGEAALPTSLSALRAMEIVQAP